MSVLVGHRETLSRIPNPLPQVLLLMGPEGVGKSIAARVLAHHTGVSDADYQRIEKLTKADALAVKEHHSRYPLESDVRVSVIDITKAGPEALNALLTLLEAPPEYSHFILHSNTTPFLTIQSRCFILRFGHLSDEEVTQVLEAKKVPSHTIADAVRLSQGRVSVALSHAHTYEARKHAGEILKAVQSQNSDSVTRALQTALEKGRGRDAAAEVAERREAVRSLIAKSLRSSLSNDEHLLAFIPQSYRLESLQTLESPARASIALPAAVWTLVGEV